VRECVVLRWSDVDIIACAVSDGVVRNHVVVVFFSYEIKCCVGGVSKDVM